MMHKRFFGVPHLRDGGLSRSEEKRLFPLFSGFSRCSVLSGPQDRVKMQKNGEKGRKRPLSGRAARHPHLLRLPFAAAQTIVVLISTGSYGQTTKLLILLPKSLPTQRIGLWSPNEKLDATSLPSPCLQALVLQLSSPSFVAHDLEMSI